MTTFHIGDCRSCGQELITVEGAETYHPWDIEWPDLPDERCPELLPIGDSGSFSRNVSADANIVREIKTL